MASFLIFCWVTLSRSKSVGPVGPLKVVFLFCMFLASRLVLFTVPTKTQLSNFLGTPGEDYFKGNPKSLNFYFLVVWWGKFSSIYVPTTFDKAVGRPRCLLFWRMMETSIFISHIYVKFRWNDIWIQNPMGFHMIHGTGIFTYMDGWLY